MSTIDDLGFKLGVRWEHIAQAHDKSVGTLNALEEALAPYTASDTSIVVLGSLARLEMTSGSDIDWMLLLDGSSDPNHHEIFLDIADRIALFAKKPVGQEGTFGNGIVSSHDLINYIGGEGDTNSNTTRRNLMLLESRCVGSDEAYSRVKKNLLKRYLAQDSGLWRPAVTRKVPHFLLNDLARYWRTMTVDYAYKERTRGGKGIPLRNIKLGMSRKLIYLAGLLTCFDCHLSFSSDEERSFFYEERNVQSLIVRVDHVLKQTPLQIVAASLLKFPEHFEAAKLLFGSYDRFLALLLDPESRMRLERLDVDEQEQEPLYAAARMLRTDFQRAIRDIFLTNDSVLGRLTIRYGVF